MVINSFLLNARHPALFLPRNNKIYLAQDGVTEIEGPGYEDKRNFLVTLVDPFDIVGLVRRRERGGRYWEEQQELGVPAVRAETSQNLKSNGN